MGYSPKTELLLMRSINIVDGVNSLLVYLKDLCKFSLIIKKKMPRTSMPMNASPIIVLLDNLGPPGWVLSNCPLKW